MNSVKSNTKLNTKLIGADLIALELKKQGVDVIFEYPGGTIVFILDSIRRLTNIKIITCRHEAAASYAASAYSKHTEKVGVCMATSGAGAVNLVSGIADAYFDHTPLLVITGQVPSHQYQASRDRQTGFQEIDIVAMTKPITAISKQITRNLDKEIHSALIMAEMSHAPVLLDIPIDIQREYVK